MFLSFLLYYNKRIEKHFWEYMLAIHCVKQATISFFVVLFLLRVFDKEDYVLFKSIMHGEKDLFSRA